MRRYDFLCDSFETWIAAQWIDEGVDSNPAYVRTSSILIALFQPPKRFFFIAESEINNDEAVR